MSSALGLYGLFYNKGLTSQKSPSMKENIYHPKLDLERLMGQGSLSLPSPFRSNPEDFAIKVQTPWR